MSRIGNDIGGRFFRHQGVVIQRLNARYSYHVIYPYLWRSISVELSMFDVMTTRCSDCLRRL